MALVQEHDGNGNALYDSNSQHLMVEQVTEPDEPSSPRRDEDPKARTTSAEWLDALCDFIPPSEVA